MAGAKETPRQKLIALMYLVFITMLALNVSKEVLDGFGQMFKKIASANDRVDQSNDIYYNKIEVNAKEKEGKWIDNNRIAVEIKKEAEIKTMAVGRIIDAEQAEAILRDRDADLIGIGRELMYNPFWGLHAAETLKNETALEGWPDQYRWAITRRADLEKNDR